MTKHWLSIAAERVAAGEPEEQVLADYGYCQAMLMEPKDSIIPLNKDHNLCNERRAWVLRKYTGINAKTQERVWMFVANWQTFESAACGLIERQIKAAGPVTLAEAVNACRSASQMATKILSGQR